MESTHARNVGLAKFVNDCLYDTKNPAQQKDANIRNSIAGFPILLYINDELQGVYNFNLDRYSTKPYGYTDTEKCLVYEVSANSDTTAGAFYKWSESSGKSQLDYYKSDFECLYPPTRANGNDNMSELIRLIEWVNDSSDEDFKDNIGRYFNLEYLLRYYLFVLVFGAVDSLGKNMKLTTWDGLVWYPQVYDADTTIGLDNTGFLKFDMDIEMGDKNVFNTTGSQLWRKIVLLFDAELKVQYSLMRQDRFTVDNIMKYLYGEQISQIPAYYYNKDMQTKYLNFGSSYLYALHGSGEQHIRKWIRERLMYCDTLLGYRASSSDYITLRSSKLGEVYLDVETYIPMYLSIKWRDEANNTGLQTKRVGRGEKVRFTYNMPTATDQEIIVYAGHYLKSLGDVSNLQPTSMLIANADRLTEIECHSPNLINTDLSECTKLQRIDLSDCTALGTGIGAQPILNIQNCKYLRYCDCRNTQLTAIYTMQAGGNLEEIYYPQSTQVVQLTNQTYLHTVGLPSTSPCKNLANVQITNCNAVKRLSSETTALDFNTFKYVQNLNITNSLSGLDSMNFNGFDKLRNVTLSSLKELDSIGFEDMMPVTTTSTLKNITISDCPLITSLSFNVSSDDYKVAFAGGGKLDLGGLQSLKSIECNTSVKGLDTLIVPTSLTDLRFTTEHGDGINGIKNIWSASAVHNNDGFEGIDFQDMTIEFIDMLGLNGISNAINFHIAPKTQNPNLNTARDGSTDKPWFHPIGSIDLSNYTGLMIGMLRGVDLNKLDVVINTNRDQVDLTSLFECATLPTAQNIVTKTNNILAKFPKSIIWDYMFRGCDLSFSPKDITIPNRGLSLKGMYKDSNVTEDVSLPNVIMAVDEMFMNCTGITTYEKNWLKTYAKIAYTVPASNGTSGSWDDNGNYTEGTNYNQFLYTLSDGEKAFKIMTTGTGVVRINYFHNASFMSRVVYTPKFDSYPYVVTIPDGCNKVIFVCDKTIGFTSEGTITTSNCYTNTGGVLSEIPVSWGGYGLDKNVTSIYVIDTTHLTNTTTFNLVLQDNQAGITDWGDGVTNSEKSHTYAEHGTYTIKTKSWSNGTPSDDLKNALIEVKQIKLIGHNGNSKDYSNAFNGCTNLRKVTAYNLAPTNCSYMFKNCTLLTNVVGLDTWDMSNSTNINYMFSGAGITDPTPVYNMLSTFTGSSADSLFRESKIESIELGRFPSSIKNFGDIARGCTNLKTIDFTGASHNVINWSYSFSGCSNVTSLISLETLNASDGVDLTNMMDRVGTRLETIDMSGMTCKIGNPTRFNNGGHTLKTIKLGWDWINVTRNPDYFLADFYSLENIEWGTNIKINIVDSWKINEQQKLTVQSLVNLFNALYNFSTDGGTHTVIIGATNIAKLTREQMLIAIKKHWTIQGAPIQGVFRDTDISTLTSDDTVTAVAIELTADNYLTRIDEVLGVYTNAVDVYFFDDGSVTTLANMCYNNNTATKDRIQNVTFLDGYFENCTSFMSTLRELKGLVTVTGMPDNVRAMNYALFNVPTLTSVSKIPSKCTNFNVAFRGCTNLTSVPINGWTGNLYMIFMDCNLLNQQINITNPTDLSYTFCNCSSLEISPTFTGTYTGAISNLFSGCRKLTKITLPTTWKPSSTQNTFNNCTKLVTIENLGTLDMSNCSDVSFMFSKCGLTDYSSVENWEFTVNVTCDGCFAGTVAREINLSNWNRNNVFTSIGSAGAGLFQNSKVEVVNLTNLVSSNTKTALSLFESCPTIKQIIGTETWDISGMNGYILERIFYSSGATLEEFNISNWVFPKNINPGIVNYRFHTAEINKLIANNISCTPSQFNGFLTPNNDNARIKEIVMDEFLPTMTDFSGMCQGLRTLTKDIVFPPTATNVSNCFKGCTSMTHIHSNWKTEYTAMENTTDCYAGCTGITHCDGVDIGVNEYITGLDEVPTAWGGFGFSKDVTSIIVVEIPSDNYEMSVCVYPQYNLLSTKTINWGDGTVTAGTNTHTYATAGTYVIKGHIGFGHYMAASQIRNCLIEVKQLATLSNLFDRKSFYNTFNDCSKLTKVTAYNLAPINCTNMFYNCSSLTEIIGIETWDMSGCTDCDYMFRNCSSLINIDVSNWNVSKVSTFAGIFFDCNNLSVLNISNWRPINANNMQTMFRNCSKLTELNISNWGTLPKVKTLYSTFDGCSGLTELVLPTFTTTLTNMRTTFANCTNLITLDISNCDLSNVEIIDAFSSTTNLTNINSGTNISNDIIFSYCNKLTVTSLLSIINNLATVSNNKTLTLGSTNLAKLTDEQIAIATNKGWTVQ